MAGRKKQEVEVEDCAAAFYSVNAAVQFHAGAVLGLTDKQALDRATLLEQTEQRGRYVATGTVTFKGGEVIEIVGEVAKCYVDKLSPA